MARTFAQTDLPAPNSQVQACSGTVETTSIPRDRRIDTFLEAGSGVQTVEVNNSSALRGIHMQSPDVNETTWPAGTVTVKLNVSLGNTVVVAETLYVCQVSNTGSNKATWGSLVINAVMSFGV